MITYICIFLLLPQHRETTIYLDQYRTTYENPILISTSPWYDEVLELPMLVLSALMF